MEKPYPVFIHTKYHYVFYNITPAKRQEPVKELVFNIQILLSVQIKAFYLSPEENQPSWNRAHEYWFIWIKRRTSPTNWFFKNTPKVHWHAVGLHLTFLSECINLENLSAEINNNNKGLSGSLKLKRKKFNIYILLFSNKYEMECTLVVKLPNNQRAAQWLKRTLWKPLTPLLVQVVWNP